MTKQQWAAAGWIGAAVVSVVAWAGIIAGIRWAQRVFTDGLGWF